MNDFFSKEGLSEKVVKELLVSGKVFISNRGDELKYIKEEFLVEFLIGDNLSGKYTTMMWNYLNTFSLKQEDIIIKELSDIDKLIKEYQLKIEDCEKMEDIIQNNIKKLRNRTDLSELDMTVEVYQNRIDFHSYSSKKVSYQQFIADLKSL